MSGTAPTHPLRPTAPIAPDALLPGDPGRALALAQDLLTEPRMANHARGLWGYSGKTGAGTALTVQATGIGGPSIAIVVEELAELGVKRAIRLGTCQAIDPARELGDLVVAKAAIPLVENGGGDRVALAPDPVLTEAITGADPSVAATTVGGTDLYYDPDHAQRTGTLRAAGAGVIDLGTAATLLTGRRLGVSVASGLVVARTADGRALDDDDVERCSVRLGRLASAVLGG